MKLYSTLHLWNKIQISWICFPVIRHTHLPLCCSNMLCSVLSQTLYHDASPQRRGHRQRSLCQERRESPCSSKVPCLVPGQRGHGPQSSHGDCVQTTCKHKSIIKGSESFLAVAEGCRNGRWTQEHCSTVWGVFLQVGTTTFSSVVTLTSTVVIFGIKLLLSLMLISWRYVLDLWQPISSKTEHLV